MTLRDRVNVLRRRKFIVLECLIVVPLIVFVVSSRQARLYEASATLLLNRDAVASSLTGIDPFGGELPADFVQSQADLARSDAILSRAMKTARVRDLASSSRVVTRAGATTLEFRVTNASPAVAERAANDYARAFVAHRATNDARVIGEARRNLARRIAQLERAGQGGSGFAVALLDRDQQLETLQKLHPAPASFVSYARGATQVQPRPLRNALFGLGLGAVLAIALAFVADALDTRLRSAEKISEALGMPLLARIPNLPRNLRKEKRIGMLAQPGGAHAEAFRLARANLEYVGGAETRALMVTSALEGEGKSTTAANLAVALARGGAHVLLVDLDMRRPSIHELLELERSPGVAEALLGEADLDAALRPNVLNGAGSSKSVGAQRNGRATSGGLLDVLPAGRPVADVGDLVAGVALGALLGDLRERADYVVVDSPPLLSVGDGVVLAAKLDGIVVVTQLDRVRRPILNELRRVLAGCPGRKLGFILVSPEHEEESGYGTYYGYGAYATEPEPEPKDGAPEPGAVTPRLSTPEA